MSYSHGELVQLAEEGRRKKMDELISRQAAIDALEREKTYCTAFRDGYTPINVFEKYNAGLTDGIKALKKLPPADVVEVVRCKDCEYCEEVDFGLWYCNSEDFKVVGSYTEADFYCGAGLRKRRKEKEDGSTNT